MSQQTEVAYPDVPAAGSLADGAGGLVPLLRANARTVDEQGRLTDDNVAALTSAGLYKMMTPRQFGGFETPLIEQAEVLAELGRGCPSTGWVAGVEVFSAWLATQFSDEAQADVFGTPDVRLSGIFTPTATAERVDGGFIINGSWAFNTGCLHAHWDVLPARLTTADGQVEIVAFLIPMTDLNIEMSWDVDGLAGTGSNTSVARKVFVPEHRAMPLADLWQDGAKQEKPGGADISDAPAMSVMWSLTAAVPVGMARGAMDLFLDRLPGRAVTYTPHSNQALTELAHLQVAEAQTKIDLAWHLVSRTAESAWAHAQAGTDPSALERARHRSDAAYSTRLAREAVETLNAACGATSIRKDVPFRQFFRDIQAVALHAALNPGAGLEVYGRVLLGLDHEGFLL